MQCTKQSIKKVASCWPSNKSPWTLTSKISLKKSVLCSNVTGTVRGERRREGGVKNIILQSFLLPGATVIICFISCFHILSLSHSVHM